MADRVNKLREMFNKASEGKSKLSVNDFSEYILNRASSWPLYPIEFPLTESDYHGDDS